MPGLNSQVPSLRARVAGVALRGREIAIRQALLENGLRGLPDAPPAARTGDTARPIRDRASASPSKMESSEACVLRSTSVSSMRRIMVPPLWRAYSQLKMNVRALPMWRKPVGDGAKRTLSIEKPSITSGFRAPGQAQRPMPLGFPGGKRLPRMDCPAYS